MEQKSKFLSLVLRHQPDKINIELDNKGWASVDSLLKNMPFDITFEELKVLVDGNDKQRFSFNSDLSQIRANQGHSIQNIDLSLETTVPPVILYHGTVSKYIDRIQKEGIKKMNRVYVHLSHEEEIANKVGSRKGIPILLQIKALEMFKDGISFYKSKNGVWLTDHVPVKYIIFRKCGII